MTARLAVVMSGFPRTSETFALGELAALARAGMLVRVYATKPGDGEAPHPGAEEILPLVRMLPPGGAAQQARTLVDDLGGTEVDGIHGYFAHQPTEVASLAARALGVGYSFSVHALDARKVPPDDLARRARAAAGVVACNTDVAQYVDVPGARLRLLPHGVDLTRFGPRPRPSGEDDDRLRVLAVGRLVEKKGFPTLVQAAARMRGAVAVPVAVDDRRHRDDVGPGVLVGELEVRPATDELHRLAEVVALDGLLHRRLPDPRADDPQHGGDLQPGDCVQQRREALLLDEPTHRQDPEPAVALGAGPRAEAGQVDPVRQE